MFWHLLKYSLLKSIEEIPTITLHSSRKSLAPLLTIVLIVALIKGGSALKHLQHPSLVRISAAFVGESVRLTLSRPLQHTGAKKTNSLVFSLDFLQLQVHCLLLHSFSTSFHIALLHSKSTFVPLRKTWHSFLMYILRFRLLLAWFIQSHYKCIRIQFFSATSYKGFDLKPDESAWVTVLIGKGYELNWKSAPTAADIMACRFLSSRSPKQ